MPVTSATPLLTLFRNGQAKLNDRARRSLLGKPAVLLAAPSAIGTRWLLVPVEQAAEGAQPLYDDRGKKGFGAYALAASVFALLPAEQKSASLELLPAPLGFWLAPRQDSGGLLYKNELPAQAA